MSMRKTKSPITWRREGNRGRAHNIFEFVY